MRNSSTLSGKSTKNSIWNWNQANDNQEDDFTKSILLCLRLFP